MKQEIVFSLVAELGAKPDDSNDNNSKYYTNNSSELSQPLTANMSGSAASGSSSEWHVNGENPQNRKISDAVRFIMARLPKQNQKRSFSQERYAKYVLTN